MSASTHADAVGLAAHDIPCTNLADSSATTIAELAQGKLAVLDFWTTKCTRCPMAIEKLNRLAAGEPVKLDGKEIVVEKGKVAFITVNCDDAEWAAEIAEEEEWDSLTNVFIAEGVKEEIKAKWGLRTVPHYTLIGADGTLLQNASADSPTKFDYEALAATAAAFDPAAAAATAARTERAEKLAEESATPAKVPPLELKEETSPVFSPEKDENLSEAEQVELTALQKENEEMRLKIAELSAEQAEEGPESPGYGSNPLNFHQVVSEEDEPLLQENPSRFVIFPISDHEVWARYKHVESRFWNAEEIETENDAQGFQALGAAERSQLTRLLPLLCEVGQALLDNLLNRFTQEVQSTEARMFFGNEIAMLNMHNEMWGMLMNVYLPGDAAQAQLQAEVKQNPASLKKMEWCQQWTNSKASFGLRLLAFAAVQSVMHCGAFACLTYAGNKEFTDDDTSLNGLKHAVAKIATDTQEYVDFAALLFSMLQKKPAAADMERIVRDAAAIEKDFILNEFKATDLGVDASQMDAFVEFSADELLKGFGQSAVYNVTNPFSWMESKAAAAPKALAPTSSASPKTVEATTDTTKLSFGLDDDDF